MSDISQAFPYGVGNYQKLKASGYYLYVDKTKFIERLELSRILYPVHRASSALRQDAVHVHA